MLCLKLFLPYFINKFVNFLLFLAFVCVLLNFTCELHFNATDHRTCAPTSIAVAGAVAVKHLRWANRNQYC